MKDIGVFGYFRSMSVFVNEVLGLVLILFDDFDDFAIVHAGDAVSIRKNTIVVRDNDHGAIHRASDFAEKIEHNLTIVRVQGSRGFVTDDKWWFVDECARNRDTLLLAAGEFVRAFFPTIAEADFFENFARTLDRDAAGMSLNQQGHAHVFCNGKRRDEIELLENEADVFCPKTGEGSAGHFFERTIEDMNRAALDFQCAGNGAEQSGFSTA
jgi:hypothetical protein